MAVRVIDVGPSGHDWACVRRDRYCLQCTLHSVLVNGRKLAKGESNAGFHALGGATELDLTLRRPRRL